MIMSKSSLLLIALGLAAGAASAQVPPPPPDGTQPPPSPGAAVPPARIAPARPAPPPAVRAPDARPPAAPLTPPAPPAPLAPTGVAEGVVQRYLTTPYGELNGLRLRDGRIVLFAPPMAPSVRDAAAIGERIRIIGNSGADGAIHATAILNLASGQSAADQPPSIPPAPAAPRPQPGAGLHLQTCEAAGAIDAVLHGPRGEANGVILTDGAIIYFRPDLVRGPLSPGQSFAAIGIGSRSAQGLALEAIAAGPDLASIRSGAILPTPPRPQESHAD